MLSLSHTFISLPFALYFKNPALIFLVAFGFHLCCDWLLHWNIYAKNFKQYPVLLVAGDIIVGLLISYVFLGNKLFTVPYMAAIAGGNMPDILHGFWDMTPQSTKDTYFSWAKPFFSFHNKLQHETDNVWLGLISQIILIGLSFYLLRVPS